MIFHPMDPEVIYNNNDYHSHYNNSYDNLDNFPFTALLAIYFLATRI